MGWHDTDYYLPSNQASVLFSRFVVGGVWGVAVVSLLAFVAARVLREWSRARAAAAAVKETETRSLRSGLAILHGVVEASGKGIVARIAVRQVGNEYAVGNGRMRHTWAEVERRAEAGPFSLRLASGQVVAVEARSDPRILGPLLTRRARGAKAERWRVREITTGDPLFVRGELAVPTDDAYRSPVAGLTISAPLGEQILLSPEPLEKPLLSRARFHLKWFAVIVTFFVFIHVAVFGSFWRGSLRGVTTPFHVTDTRSYGNEFKDWSRYQVEGTLEGAGHGNAEWRPVSKVAYEEAKQALAVGYAFTVPIVVCPGETETWLGTTPTLQNGCVLACLLLVALVVVYLLHARVLGPWDGLKKLDESGSGRLKQLPEDLPVAG